jgi:hypothetical protein
VELASSDTALDRCLIRSSGPSERANEPSKTLFSFNAAGPFSPGCAAALPGPLEGVAALTGGWTVEVCGMDAQPLPPLPPPGFGFGNPASLSGMPADPGAIRVWVDAVEVPANDPATGEVNWSYDAASNRVNFGPGFPVPPGAVVTVRYDEDCSP